MTTPGDEGGLHCDHAAAVLKTARLKIKVVRIEAVRSADFIEPSKAKPWMSALLFRFAGRRQAASDGRRATDLRPQTSDLRRLTSGDYRTSGLRLVDSLED